MNLMPIKEGLKYSVIIPSWNGVEHLTRCVQSVLKHTNDFELIVVDNGSDDGSRGYCLGLLDDCGNYAGTITSFIPHGERNIPCKLILNNENRNFGPACNQGLELAEGKEIIILNSDVIVTPEWADRLSKCLNHVEKTGIVGPVSNHSAGRQQVVDAVAQNALGQPLDLDASAYLWGNNNNRRYSEAGTLYGWCMMFSRAFLDTQEYLFDEQFANAYEDNDVCIRAQRLGWKMFIDFSTFIWHVGQGSFVKVNVPNFMDHYIENGNLNAIKFRAKWKPKADQKLIAVYRIANCEQYIAASMMKTSKFADEIICLFARSQDRTKEIALGFPKVTAWEEWTEPDHPFDEQAERNWLLQKAIERGADWVISIDGDEIYEDKFIGMMPRLLHNPNPHIVGYWCNWRTIWKRDGGQEYYRADSTFGAFQNYRFFKVLPGMEIKPNSNIYNHHCGSAPLIPRESLQWLNVRVKHLGYDSEEQRKRKYEFYRKADPRPVLSDVGTNDYHHLIDEKVVLKKWKPDNRLTVLIICKDEEKVLGGLLACVEPVADEFVIVDTGSTDGTARVIERFSESSIKPVRVIHKTFESVDEEGRFMNYSEVKNWAKSQCKTEWILQMDCDELFEVKDVGNLFAHIDEDCEGYLFNVINYLEIPKSRDPKDNRYSVSETIRLFRNIDELFYTGLVHESLEDAVSFRHRATGARFIQSPYLIHHRGFLKDKAFLKKKVNRYHRINKAQSDVSGGKDPRPLFNMALHLLAEGDRQAAINYLTECLKLEPTLWRASQSLGFMHLEEAKIFLNRTMSDMPDAYKQNSKSNEFVTMLNKHDFALQQVC